MRSAFANISNNTTGNRRRNDLITRFSRPLQDKNPDQVGRALWCFLPPKTLGAMPIPTQREDRQAGGNHRGHRRLARSTGTTGTGAHRERLRPPRWRGLCAPPMAGSEQETLLKLRQRKKGRKTQKRHSQADEKACRNASVKNPNETQTKPK